MIVAMARVSVAVREEQRDRLLNVLGSLGVLHLVPIDRADAGAEESLQQAIDQTKQAVHVLKGTHPAGATPAGEPADLVHEILEIRRRHDELQTRLALLGQEAQLAARWGRVTRIQLDELRELGAEIQLVEVRADDVPALRADIVEIIEALPRGRAVVLLVRPLSDVLRVAAEIIPPPRRNLQAVMQETAIVRDTIAADEERLAQLAHRAADIADEVSRAEERLNWERARRGGVDGERLFGVQGWMPRERAAALAADLADAGILAAVQTRQGLAHERPPTLIYYPRWLRPIRSIFDLLGISPGYDEVDVSAFFMVAVPLFAGMIIADAGYGLLFLLLPFVALRRLQAKLGKEKVQLLMLFGTMALIWGAISGVWFGLTPAQLMSASGASASVGSFLDRLQLIRGTEEEARLTLFKICFLLGSVHLILARIRRMITIAPQPTALAELGWCGVLVAMLGLIWQLFFGDQDPLPAAMTRTMVGTGVLGFMLVALFSTTAGNVLVRVAGGLAGALLPTIATFGDTLSYLRLAAVGLAGYYLAVASNTLAADAARSATWAAGIPVLLIGHLLNIGLILIAIFAHGVRLNLLEFSSNAGIQWTGYPFRPFAQRMSKEL